MKKVLKILFIVLVVLLALLIALPYLFKGKILETAKTEINKSVEAQVDFSDVRLSLFRSFPDLQVGLKDLTVVGYEPFQQDTLVAFQSFTVDVDLSSLFGSQLQVNAIHLKQPQLYAHVLEDGRANWDIAPESEPEPEAPEDTTTSEPSDYTLSLKEFTISNARVAYLDEASQMVAVINGLNYKLSGDFSEKQTNLHNLLTVEAISFAYDNVQYLNQASARFDAEIAANLVDYKFEFSNNQFMLNELQLNFDGWLQMIDKRIDMDIHFNSPATDFREVLSLIPAIYMKDFESIETSGSFAFAGYARGTYQGEQIPGFGAELEVNDARFSYPDVPESIENIQIQARMENPGGDGYTNNVSVDEFSLEMAENPFMASLDVRTTKEDVTMQGDLDGRIDFSTLNQLVELEDMQLSGLLDADFGFNGKLSDIENENYEAFQTAGRLAMTNFRFASPDLPDALTISDALIKFNSQQAELVSFESTLGESDISLNGQLNNYLGYAMAGETLQGRLNVRSNYINANPFVMASPDTVATEETPDTTQLMAVEIPQNIHFRLSTRIDKLTYDNMDIELLIGDMTVKDGRVSLDNLNLDILGGRILMSGFYDSKDLTAPEVDFDMSISKISIAESYATFNTVKQLAPIAQDMNGELSTKLKIAGQLDAHMNPVFATFNGGGELESERIEVKDNDLFQSIAAATQAKEFENPALRDVFLDFEIVDGRVFIESKDIQMAGHSFTISGSQGLDQSMDYQIVSEVPQSVAQAGGDLLAGLASQAGLSVTQPDNLSLLVGISGQTTDPEFSVQVMQSGESAREAAKDKLQDELDARKKQAEEKAKEKAEEVKDQATEQAKEELEKGKEKAKEETKKAKKKAKKKLKEKLKNWGGG